MNETPNLKSYLFNKMIEREIETHKEVDITLDVQICIFIGSSMYVCVCVCVYARACMCKINMYSAVKLKQMCHART